MEAWISFIVMAVLLLPAAVIVAVVLGIGAFSRLRAVEKRLGALEAAAREAARARADALRHEAEQRAAEAGPSAARPSPAAAPPDLPPAPAGAAPGAPPVPVESAPLPLPPPASVPPTPPQPAPPGLEERFGTRWVVWAGGLALALGGVFLVRYSIEQGLIGPGVRIALGGLLGAALIAAGEGLRRRENRAGSLAGSPSAHIPGILTAAGTTVCYATVFAAYALYDFLGPAPAFVLLGIVALLTLGAALLHGPALAALGLVGAEVTPMLVAAGQPDYWALYVYLAVVTAAAFALARLRLWRRLAVAALGFGLFWALPGLSDWTGMGAPFVFHAAAGFVLAAAIVVAGLFLGPESPRGRTDALSSASIGVYLFIAALFVLSSRHEPVALASFALLAAATVAIAWRSDAAAAALPAAGALSALVIAAWAVQPELTHLVAPPPGDGPEPSQADIVLHLALGAFFSVLFGLAGYLAQGRQAGAAIALMWSSTAVLAPLAILAALYYGIHGLDRSLSFAAIALALAAWFAVAAERLTRAGPRPGVPAAAALHAAGSAAALALALTFSLEKGWLTVGLALMAPGVAWVADKRPLPLLRWAAAAAAALVMARIVWEPRIAGGDLGTAPFFNWLLWGYGAPALAFWTAGFLLRRRADDAPSRAVDAAAILFTVLFAVMEIRHAMNGGDVYAASSGLAEAALHACVGLALAAGLEWLRQRTGNVVHNVGALAVAGVTLVLIMTELLGVENPRLTGEPVGGAFLNLVLLGYGLPAGLAIALALVARRTRPMPYRMTAATVSVVLALAYLTLEVMRLYHGPELAGEIGDAESYTFSAVWLAFGVALLAIGVPLDSKPARLASAAVVALATAKIFLFDLNNLGGIWRALSFIGLGLVLVGIGWLYQRLLFPPRQAIP